MSENLSKEVKKAYESEKSTLKQEAGSVLKEISEKIELKKKELYKEVEIQ
jgi:hypothetical protein